MVFETKGVSEEVKCHSAICETRSSLLASRLLVLSLLPYPVEALSSPVSWPLLSKGDAHPC